MHQVTLSRDADLRPGDQTLSVHVMLRIDALKLDIRQQRP